MLRPGPDAIRPDEKYTPLLRNTRYLTNLCREQTKNSGSFQRSLRCD